MNYFENLPWRISDPSKLNDYFDFVSDESLSTLPIFQISTEKLLTSLFEKYKKVNKKKPNGVNVRGYRQIPELETTKLSIQNHKEYLELLMFYEQENQRLNPKIKTLMASTQNLEPLIQAERQIYADFVKNRWTINGSERCKQIKKDIETFFDEEWIKRIQIIDHYPAYYSTEKFIPIFPKEEVSIEMKCACNLFEMGNVQCLPKPPDKKRIFLEPNKIKSSDFYNFSNKPVSLDPTAEKLAKDYKADIVISSSGMKHIMNNHAPYINSWNLPVKIEEHSIIIDNKKVSKKIIFIDKALPKNYLNNVQKNYWVYKKILKPNFCKGISKRFKCPIFKNDASVCNCSNTTKFDEQLETNDGEDEKDMNTSSGIGKNLSVDESNDTLIIDVSPTEHARKIEAAKLGIPFKRSEPIITRSKAKRSVSPSFTSPINIKRYKLTNDVPNNAINSKLNTMEENLTPNSMRQHSKSSPTERNSKLNSNDQNSKLNSVDQNMYVDSSNTNDKSSKVNCKCKIRKQLNGVNVTYNLWNLKVENHRLRKPTSQEINILVRCKIDACQKVSGEYTPIILTPKLEYQLEYGAEICTKVDLCRQWISASLLPGSKIMRVRIDSENSEFIKWQETNAAKIANELTTFYKHNPNIGWQCLYSVLADVMKSSPGEYMLSHNPRNGPFISLLRSCGKNSNFNLNFTDLKHFFTKEERNYPFIPIDTRIILPNHIKQGVIPGLFKGVQKVITKRKRKNKNNNRRRHRKKRQRKNKNNV